MDAHCDKFATIKLSWQHLQQSICHSVQAEKSTKFRVWDKVPFFGNTQIHF